MNYNAIISILVHKGVIGLEVGEKLAKELATTIVETNFAAAHRNVEALLAKIEKDAAPIIADIEKVVAKKN